MSSLRHAAAALSGMLFAQGLITAGVVRPEVVSHALRWDASWDPSLYLMFAGALLVHVPLSQWVHRRGTSLTGAALPSPRGVVDAKLVTGSIVFGIGWGIGGICPGPMLVGVLSWSPALWVFVPGYVLGVVLASASWSWSPAGWRARVRALGLR